MFYFNFSKIFNLRGIKYPFAYLQTKGFSRSQARLITSRGASSLRLKTLEQLCILLSCTPNDVLEWYPAKDLQLHSAHPLHKLIPAHSFDFAALTKDVSVSDMPEIINAINEAKEKLKEV
jgi:DNA-binding Xre family transcriptional regulator